MKWSNLFRWLTAATLAIALASRPATARADDTLSISGAFHMDSLSQGVVGADLVDIFTDGNDYGWTLTLHGVTYSHHFYDKKWITRVHATSFDFEFFGPEANLLNEIVSARFTRGILTD